MSNNKLIDPAAILVAVIKAVPVAFPLPSYGDSTWDYTSITILQIAFDDNIRHSQALQAVTSIPRMKQVAVHVKAPFRL